MKLMIIPIKKEVLYWLFFFAGLLVVVLILKFIQQQIENLIKKLIFRKKQKTVSKLEKLPFDISKMSGVEFESFITKVFKLAGYKTTDIQPTRDGGVDIVAKMKDKTYYIQCKRYKKETKIGIEALNKFLGVMADKKIKKGFFITTSYFTKEAENFAKRNNIKLIDKQHFDDLEQFLKLLY